MTNVYQLRVSLNRFMSISISRLAIQRVLTMVCNTQSYWGFRLCPSAGILKIREHNVSENESVSDTLCFLVSRIPDDGQSSKTQ
jgi:hypothetical protein